MRRLLANGWIVTMDDAGTEHESGWVLVDGAWSLRWARGAAGGGRGGRSRRRVVTPGLVNTHHHLFQS